jgi:hypothetical protein
MNAEAPPYQLELVETALHALEKQTGIEGVIVNIEPNIDIRHQPDCDVELRLKDARYPLLAEVKVNVDRRPILAQVKNQLGEYGDRGILITPHLTPRMVDHCREINLQFLDANGNAYINQHGLYVLIKGQKIKLDAKLVPPKFRAWTPTALKITFLLLCNRTLRNATYRELAKAATVALGAVGQTYDDLAQRGYITTPKTHHRFTVLEPEKMIDDWVANYPVNLRRKLVVGKFRVDDPNWWRNAELPKGAEWGGEVAADRLTRNLKPVTQTLYINQDPDNTLIRNLVQNLRLKRDPTGTVEVLHKFWNFEPDDTPQGVVPPLLIYVDLMATLQPRNIEIAAQIHDEYLRYARD